MNWIYMKKEELLKLKPSISSWILLRDYALGHAEPDIYEKIVRDYFDVCPAFEFENIFNHARASLTSQEYQDLVSLLSEYGK